MRYFIFLLCFICQNSWSSAVISEGTTSKSVCGGDQTCTTIILKWKNVDTSSSGMNQVACTKSNGCKYGPVFGGFDNGYMMQSDQLYNVIIDKDDTFAEADSKYRTKYGNSGQDKVYYLGLAYHCALFSVFDNNTGDDWIYSGAAPGISGNCTEFTGRTQCDFVEQNINLEHGNLGPSEIDGHAVSQSIQVACSGVATVSFKGQSGADVSLKNGEIMSHLTIDGKDLDESNVYEVPAGISDFNLESKLRTNNSVTAGVFTGSEVLIINIL